MSKNLLLQSPGGGLNIHKKIMHTWVGSAGEYSAFNLLFFLSVLIPSSCLMVSLSTHPFLISCSHFGHPSPSLSPFAMGGHSRTAWSRIGDIIVGWTMLKRGYHDNVIISPTFSPSSGSRKWTFLWVGARLLKVRSFPKKYFPWQIKKISRLIFVFVVV